MQSMGRRIVALMAFLVGALGFVELSHGHALQPGYLELRLIDKELYAVVWKTPAVGGRPMAITALLPENCDPRTPGQPSWDGETTFKIQCLLFRIFVGCTSRCGRAGRGRGWSLVDPKPTYGR